MNATIISPICPLMTEPSLSSALADEGLLGWPIEILDAPTPGWLLAKTAYRYTGYIQHQHIAPGCGAALSWALRPKKLVTAAVCDVLSEPIIQSPRVETLLRGCLVAAWESEAANYQKVLLPDGQKGYVKKNYLEDYTIQPEVLPESVFRKVVVASGLSYLGTPYRWAGKTPMGIDCSGLVFMSYFLNGVSIYRDARIEPGFPMMPIPISDLKRADLLYFPGHVALYLGKGKYLHATNKTGSDGVVISSLNPEDVSYREDLAQSMIAVGSLFA